MSVPKAKALLTVCAALLLCGCGQALSEREIEVLTLIAEGLMNKQIAQRLDIGLTTVISHRRNIMEKLGIRSVAGLVVYALAAGYASMDTL